MAYKNAVINYLFNLILILENKLKMKIDISKSFMCGVKYKILFEYGFSQLKKKTWKGTYQCILSATARKNYWKVMSTMSVDMATI